MILIVKNSINNDEKHYPFNDWEDLEQVSNDYPALDKLFSKVRNFDDAIEQALHYFNSHTYIMAKINKEKPLRKTQIGLGSSSIFAERLHDWIKVRKSQEREDFSNSNKNSDKIKTNMEQPQTSTFLDKLKGLFGL